MSEYGNIDTLLEINKNLKEAESTAERARIHNPAKEVEGAVADFLKARLARIEDDANFTDSVRAAIMARIAEANMDQLIELLHVSASDNNREAEGMAALFKTEAAGKTVLDHLKNNDTETVAQQLYASTNDKNILQAVTYLGSVLSKVSGDSDIIQVTPENVN